MELPAPILYEINTRVWLRELSEKAGKSLTLAEIPDSEIERWVQLGFTHIWLMGVWQIGPEARRIALEGRRENWRQEIASKEEDVHGSPYAIQEYSIDARLGRPLDLLILKERLSRAGLRLILDFVPNHVGLDSTEPERYPARFVQGASPSPGTFCRATNIGPRNFAHGRDPYFPPWIDTVQVDYRVAAAQESMAAIGQTISMFGDGLRCDMAMLVLPEIFGGTWKEFPPAGSHLTDANFWRATIPKIRLLQPNVELIAEAYWDREAELQDSGFDFTYNKRVTDYIVRGQNPELADYLHGCGLRFLERSVHFLENHDEQRAAATLTFELHKAALALVLFLPGMALLHDGQLEGRKLFAPIQMSKRPLEEPDPALQNFYGEILKTLKRSHVRRGVPQLVHVPGEKRLIVVRWAGLDGEADLALVNLSNDSLEIATSDLLLNHETKVLALYATTAGLELRATRIRIPGQSAHILRAS
jgi:hypothetical protein